MEKNQWFQVRGQVVETGDGTRALEVVAEELEPIERPIDAYGG